MALDHCRQGSSSAEKVIVLIIHNSGKVFQSEEFPLCDPKQKGEQQL